MADAPLFPESRTARAVCEVLAGLFYLQFFLLGTQIDLTLPWWTILLPLAILGVLCTVIAVDIAVTCHFDRDEIHSAQQEAVDSPSPLSSTVQSPKE